VKKSRHVGKFPSLAKEECSPKR